MINNNGKESACNAGDLGSRSPGEGNGYSLQYSCLGNPMDRGAGLAAIHGVAELDTSEHTHLPLTPISSIRYGWVCMHTF